MLFSERYGFKPVRQALQVESIDEGLRNGLWSSWFFFWYPSSRDILKLIWTEFYKYRIDKYHFDYVKIEVEKTVQKGEWFSVYDIIDYCNLVNRVDTFMNECNRVLERDMSAYRFVDGRIAPIISEIEISAIEQATQHPEGRWSPVTQHLRTALAMLSDRQQPDYRNSIKEAISSVEAASQIITGNSKATLGDTLKSLEQKGQLHKALKEGFSKLYGYTSDAGGIRHALSDDAHNVTFDEAKFMLVICSAFVNYLRPNLSDSDKVG